VTADLALPADPALPADLALPVDHTVTRPSVAIEDELLAIVHACDVATIGFPDFTLDDVREWLDSPHTTPDRDGWVVRDGSGRLVAWAYVESSYGGRTEHGIVYVQPGADETMYRPLADLLVPRAGERAAEAGRGDTELTFWTTAGEDAVEAVLQAVGCRHVRTFARMRRELDGGEGRVELPADVSIRVGVDPADDAAMRTFHEVFTASFAEHWGVDASAYESWRARLDAAAGTPYDQWLVAYVDGQPAGVMQAADASETATGWVRELGVLPEYRGRGLGRLLLDRAFAVFRDHGYRTAELGVDLENRSGAYRLYESVGMTRVFESHAWQIVVPATS
jgi:mycothiol synthase